MTRAMIAGQALDAFSFALVVTLVPALLVVEQSPLIVALYAFGGLVAVVGVKLGAASVACYTYRLKPRGIVTRLVFGAAAVSGFVGASMNLYALSVVLG